jgi:small subunit ribosomal protein S16
MVVDEARALHWLRVGAQPTEAVRTLLRKTGTLARFERLKAGEPLEALVAEATALEAGASTSPR